MAKAETERYLSKRVRIASSLMLITLSIEFIVKSYDSFLNQNV